ncbi:MAG: hypothetical protein M1815_005402 [Lichina confinis]|nr:MAG: hypothetical protein M1815_005402 [Lichina confinis]
MAVSDLVGGTVYYASETGLLQPQELLQQRTHGNALETAPSADAGASSLGGKASQSYRADAVAKDSSVKQDFASSAERALETKSPSTAGKAATAWSGMLDSISDAKSALTSIEWSSIPNTITTMILPEWVLSISGYITRLQDQLSMTPGSLAEEIWQEANDPDVNPEILWSASVRVSEELCDDEKEFLRRRRPFTKAALARYLDLEEEDVNPEDIPTIAICGSGGGLRALIAGTGSYMAAHRAGLFDCATYTAGVSGSCWLQTLYYSTVTGCRHDRILKHVKARTDVHVAFPPAALALVTTAPTNKFLLRGIIEKLQTDPDGSFGLVDVYGVLLAARLLVPKGELAVDERDLKLSSQRMYVDGGLQPLPIYTAVRHEIPLDDAAKQADSAKEAVEQVKEVAKAQSWFQWFEFTPYELWCEELHAGIPTWALGRKFDGGSSLHDENGLAWPQLRMPLLMGMWGSAFCATLSHYYQELSYTFNGVVGFESIDRFMDGINDDLIKVHPIDPTVIPNYVTGMKDQLPGTCPESILRASHLQLMDAGMSNNLPIYPLLRPGRDIDIVVAFDSSSCIRSENWLSKVDGYARQRGIKGWPVGIGWPKSAKETQANVEKLESAQAAAKQEAIEKIEQAKDQQQQESAPSPAVTSGPSRDDVDPQDLGYCTVWVGTTEERLSEEEPPPSKKVEADWEILHPSAGITVVYFPLLPNPKVEGIDPETSAFMSTWNSVYTAEQVDQLAALAQANFEEGQEQTKATIRAVYERKKRTREKKEASNKVDRTRRKMRLGIVSKKADGDHFS